jgi:hypothetical protein
MVSGYVSQPGYIKGCGRITVDCFILVVKNKEER